ncbi:MAG: hypothetical protein K0S47_543 [Herbinix sp.]|jgi:DNA repair exonuclease SbcCD nuclease subunit|nr:hypothetical protein [Herbinix sp.]
MKFIHIADVHLGATPDSNYPWGMEREKEIWNSFDEIVRICNQDKIDLLLIAGDLFHKQPLLRELKEVNYILSKLTTAMAVIIAGNHDYIGPRSHYEEFIWNDRVTFITSAAPDSIYFPHLNTEVYGFSYHTRDIKEPLYDTLLPKRDDRIHILLAHGGDELNIPINKRRVSDAGFDYVALGHIHKPEMIKDRMAYCGSLEPLDKTEIGERGYILGEITKDMKESQTKITFIPSSVRQYIRLKLEVNQDTTNGSLSDQAREAIHISGKQHIYHFILEGYRDEAVHFDKEALLKLGNVIEVTDRTVPDYDFEALYQENTDNMIGLYIKRIRENAGEDEIGKKALYYGIEALLGARDK